MMKSAGALFDARGKRLYCTISERTAFLKATETESGRIATFCLLLAYTGCRPSEALNLRPAAFDLAQRSVVIETLKKRRKGSYRAVPIPERLLKRIAEIHGLAEAPEAGNAARDGRLWPWGRSTAYGHVKRVMLAARIEGPQATAKGLRHAFAIAALQGGAPLNLVSRWMGHSKLDTTAIYANALGEEERSLMQGFWRGFELP